jgi:hypothetical protein
LIGPASPSRKKNYTITRLHNYSIVLRLAANAGAMRVQSVYGRGPPVDNLPYLP